MSELHENPAPTVPLIAAGALVVFSLLGVSWQKWVVTPASLEISQQREVLQTRTLQFIDMADGSVGVVDADNGERIDTVPVGEGGFLRGTLRGLVRERRMSDTGMDPGFRLTRFTDGTVVLTDLATGTEIDLRAFGALNAGNFLRYLSAAPMATNQGE